MIQRFLLYLFALLDAVLIARFAVSEFVPPASIINEHPLDSALAILRMVFFLSLVASAVGLLLRKKWGLIISYLQFPLRFVFMLLSFGFIAKLALAVEMPNLYLPLIFTAMALELGRLIASILIDRSTRTLLESKLKSA